MLYTMTKWYIESILLNSNSYNSIQILFPTPRISMIIYWSTEATTLRYMNGKTEGSGNENCCHFVPCSPDPFRLLCAVLVLLKINSKTHIDFHGSDITLKYVFKMLLKLPKASNDCSNYLSYSFKELWNLNTLHEVLSVLQEQAH